MQLLLETHETRSTPLGLAVSVVIHVALLGVVVAAYRTSAEERERLLDEFVTFLVPPDRISQMGSHAMTRYDPGMEGTRTPTSDKGERGAGTPGGSGRVSPTAGDTATSTKLTIDLPTVLGDSVLTEIEVDSAVKRYEWSAAPDYPITMLQKNIEGSAFVIYVVDTLGLADTASFKVVRATHDEFAMAVKDAMPRMRFRPAILGGLKVRQLVQQNFAFKIARPDSVLPPVTKPPQ